MGISEFDLQVGGWPAAITSRIKYPFCNIRVGSMYFRLAIFVSSMNVLWLMEINPPPSPHHLPHYGANPGRPMPPSCGQVFC